MMTSKKAWCCRQVVWLAPIILVGVFGLVGFCISCCDCFKKRSQASQDEDVINDFGEDGVNSTLQAMNLDEGIINKKIKNNRIVEMRHDDDVTCRCFNKAKHRLFQEDI